MSDSTERDAARDRVADLVTAFARNESDYLRAPYNETQARTEFITPLLEAFGWDVQNTKGHPLALREVIEEATVEVGEEKVSKKPDYELRLARQRKLFVEAKKPSVRIGRDRGPAFQTRRYGFSASLPISIVTNFHQLAVYDCQPVARESDEAHVARILLVGYGSFNERFDELWTILSRETVYSGAFDKRYSVDTTRRGAEQFDDFFLRQVREWREQLAVDIHRNTPDLSSAELAYAVQLFLSRIVFLRICEDREIEKYETLRDLNVEDKFDALLAVLRRADEFYDSGLFRLIDDQRLGIRISDDTLAKIISELYYPQSPYTFAVVDTEVFGEIYELFLGEVITIQDGAAKIEDKPEVVASGGVVSTPRFVADAIVSRVLIPAIVGKRPTDLEGFTVADICCGSGIFLLAAYSILLDHYLNWYLGNENAGSAGSKVFEAGSGKWQLTFEEKRRILLKHLRGVDIDPSAVEVTQFSLLLKLIEDEDAEALKDYVETLNAPALPPLDRVVRCGNSLIGEEEWQEACGPLPTVLREEINPLTWRDEFAEEMERGGFTVIVGNPPYIRIQNMVEYSPHEVVYYKHARSPFKTAQKDNFDKYALFVERILTLVRNGGRIGVIVPHKFMTIQAGHSLRRLLTSNNLIEEIVHFGAKQVFGRNTSNYTCILILNQSGSDAIRLEMVGPLEEWRYGKSGKIANIPAANLGVKPWSFANEEATATFARVRSAAAEKLSTVAEILVGMQTSADAIYVLHPADEDSGMVCCRENGRDWEIERSILRPCLHHVTLHAYVRPKANAWMIFPYELPKSSTGQPKARLLQPDELSARFPGCWGYLNAHRDKLELRSISGGPAPERQWYQYGRSQSLTKFDTARIVLPVLSREPRYSYDDTNTLFTGGGNGPYYMIRPQPNSPVSNYYLLAVLNHPLSEAQIRTSTSIFRGGYYSHGKQFIKDLPVPVPGKDEQEEIENLVKDLIKTSDEICTVRTPSERTLKQRQAANLRNTIEQRIGEVFGLSEDDIEIVHSIPIPE